MKLGYVIGRFNPLHLGHHDLIDYLIDNSDKQIIFIGSSNKFKTLENPLTFEERKSLIKIYYPDIEVLGLPDMSSMDDWKQNLIYNINNYIKTNNLEISSINLFSPIRNDDHILRSSWVPEDHDLSTFLLKKDISATLLRSFLFTKNNFNHLVKKETVDFLNNIDINFI